MITNGVPDSIIPKSNTINLLKYVPGGLFQHNKKLFAQIDGVSMGNPLAPTIASYSIGTSKKICLTPKIKLIQCYTFVMRMKYSLFIEKMVF